MITMWQLAIRVPGVEEEGDEALELHALAVHQQVHAPRQRHHLSVVMATKEGGINGLRYSYIDRTCYVWLQSSSAERPMRRVNTERYCRGRVPTKQAGRPSLSF